MSNELAGRAYFAFFYMTTTRGSAFEPIRYLKLDRMFRQKTVVLPFQAFSTLSYCCRQKLHGHIRYGRSI